MPNADSEEALSLDAAADEDGADGAAAAAGAPMEDCRNENPLLAAGAGANSSFASPFIERPPNMVGTKPKLL